MSQLWFWWSLNINVRQIFMHLFYSISYYIIQYYILCVAIFILEANSQDQIHIVPAYNKVDIMLHLYVSIQINIYRYNTGILDEYIQMPVKGCLVYIYILGMLSMNTHRYCVHLYIIYLLHRKHLLSNSRIHQHR